jgi:hypothetical protein
MLAEIEPDDAWSFRGGRQILTEKGLVEELPELAATYTEGGTAGADSDEQLRSLGWEHEVPYKYTCPEVTNRYDEQETFTAYKDGVLVEHDSADRNESGNWHLLKLEAAYRDPNGFSGDQHIDAAVVLLPSTVGSRVIEQIEADINARLANHFGFSVPLFVWQYPSDYSTEEHDA